MAVPERSDVATIRAALVRNALSHAAQVGYPMVVPINSSARVPRHKMKKLSSHTVGVDSGDVVLFSDFEDGGEMWTGRGQRERRRHIRFDGKFREPPTVQMSLSLWDVDAATVMRADLSAEAVTRSGFDMVFRTWGDTRVARVRISWMAIGGMSEEDDWEVH